MFDFFRKKPKDPIQLCISTDMHCHIVPGVDDGSPDAETSADLIESMQQWGIERIIASPHVTKFTFENNLDTLTPAMAQLHEELKRRGNDIEVTHSAEYRLDELFEERLEANDIMPLPNSYLLVENSFMFEPMNLDSLLFDLQVKGYRPILAHPERYSYYWNKKNRYDELHNAGLLFQVNVLSLAGAYGKAERKIAEHLMNKGYVDFLGTDLHRQSHVDAINAYLTTAEARSDMELLKATVKNDTELR